MDWRKDHQRATHVVREVINARDPYKLLELGAPDDEFDSEIAAIVGQIPRIQSERDATLAFSRVFSSAFDNETFKSENCAQVGHKLHAALFQNGLIDEVSG
jgi:hypothetical protein